MVSSLLETVRNHVEAEDKQGERIVHSGQNYGI